MSQKIDLSGLKDLASMAAAAAPRGYNNLSVNTSKETGPPRKKKKKKKDKKVKQKKEKYVNKNIDLLGENNNNDDTSTGRPRRASFDAKSSSYGRLDVQKPTAVVTSTKKHRTFGVPEETTDKYEDEEEQEEEDQEEIDQQNNLATITGRLGLGNQQTGSSFWFDNTPPSLVEGKYKAKMSFEAGKKLEKEAERLWDKEVEIYNKRKESGGKTSSSDGKWLRTVMRNGTLSDRVAAMSMVVQESVVHNFNTLSALVAMTKKRGSREAHLAIEAVRDLFASHILPGNRKLELFHNHPLDHRGVTATHLIWWKFESALSNKYGEFISGKYASERAAREWSTVVDISIIPPSFKPVPLSFSRSPLSKTPKQVFFNPINIFDFFYTLYYCFIIYFFV